MQNVLAIVSYNFLPPKMGGQKGIAFFYRFLSPLVNLTCITTESNDASAAKEYELLKVFSNSQLRYVNFFYFFKIRKIITEKKITHVIIEHPYYGWLGLLLKWFCNVKLIVHSHNIEALRFKSMGRWWWGILWQYEKFVHRLANGSFFIHDDDRNYANKEFRLDPAKSFTITYGIESSAPPADDEKRAAALLIREKYQIDANKKILLFNGTLDYKPNRDALDIILTRINPLLLQYEQFQYTIIICGSRLPASYKDLNEFRDQHIIYAGFVDDINIFFKGADVFLNPVIEGGGIKTKVVEALGYNLSLVSTCSGAVGIPEQITGDKMKVCADDDWNDFVYQVMSIKNSTSIPQSFFQHFYWGNIAVRAGKAIDVI